MGRGRTYTNAELRSLAHSFLHLQGTPCEPSLQPTKTFWTKIESLFRESCAEEQDKAPAGRNRRSLHEQWIEAVKAVRRFHACVREVRESDGARELGEEGKLKVALFLYNGRGGVEEGVSCVREERIRMLGEGGGDGVVGLSVAGGDGSGGGGHGGVGAGGSSVGKAFRFMPVYEIVRGSQWFCELVGEQHGATNGQTTTHTTNGNTKTRTMTSTLTTTTGVPVEGGEEEEGTLSLQQEDNNNDHNRENKDRKDGDPAPRTTAMVLPALARHSHVTSASVLSGLTPPPPSSSLQAQAPSPGSVPVTVTIPVHVDAGFSRPGTEATTSLPTPALDGHERHLAPRTTTALQATTTGTTETPEAVRLKSPFTFPSALPQQQVLAAPGPASVMPETCFSPPPPQPPVEAATSRSRTRRKDKPCQPSSDHHLAYAFAYAYPPYPSHSNSFPPTPSSLPSLCSDPSVLHHYKRVCLALEHSSHVQRLKYELDIRGPEARPEVVRRLDRLVQVQRREWEGLGVREQEEDAPGG